MSISVVINTRNEEPNIERCLKSVAWADEIIVVDMESQDRTVEKAKKYTPHIFSYEQTGYVEPARNFAISKATKDWILILDADEEIPNSLKSYIETFTSSDNVKKYAAIAIPRQNIIFGKWIAHSGWWPDRQYRLFKHGSVAWDNAIHSFPRVDGQILELAADPQLAIMHYNYQTISQFISKLNVYTSIEAANRIEGGIRPSVFKLILKPAKHAFVRYIIKCGFMDGIHGLILAGLMGFHHFSVEAKIWEAYYHKSTKKT